MNSTCAREVTVGRPAVFLDRDGVLDDPVPRAEGGAFESPLEPSEVRLAAGAAAGVRALRTAGFALIGVSNQPAAAKRQCSLDSLEAVHDRVVTLLWAEGVELDAWYYCYHHPDGLEEGLRGECSCRKPKPGLLLAAADDLHLDLRTSWIIGDSDADIAAGRRAGCRTVLVEHPATLHRRGAEVPDLRVPNLKNAWHAIRAHADRRGRLAADA